MSVLSLLTFFFVSFFFFFFFFNDTATTEIYTLSLHDALPISGCVRAGGCRIRRRDAAGTRSGRTPVGGHRSEEHTSELQSQSNLVCRLLLEKKKKKKKTYNHRNKEHIRQKTSTV